LPEMDRRRFLAECPRNVERTYTAPPLNNIPMGTSAKRTDTQFMDLQYRLSGITRPIDYFIHRVIRDDGVTADSAIEFANVMLELLLDTALQITQIRMDNIFRAAQIRGTAPRLAPTSQAPLLDLKTLVDHVNLNKAVQNTSFRSNKPQNTR
ncbi:hypothetical protein BJV82DRAFT_491944, partial [Fennellomyces sp. T-0311]